MASQKLPKIKPRGYASEVLQNQSDLNRVGQNWVMMFREDQKPNSSLAGERRNEHDPEKG
jgi:hypothetical protein